jgi:hypothetical protein
MRLRQARPDPAVERKSADEPLLSSSAVTVAVTGTTADRSGIHGDAGHDAVGVGLVLEQRAATIEAAVPVAALRLRWHRLTDQTGRRERIGS